MTANVASVWLSAALPKNASARKEVFDQFIFELASEIFRKGGRLIHGSQPEVVPPLLRAAEAYHDQVNQPAMLALFVSKYFSSKPEKYNIDLDRWQRLCGAGIVETDVVHQRTNPGGVAEESLPLSLEVLRSRLVSHANVMVAVGGKWWEVNQSLAGVPKEIELARDNNIPLFLLGGIASGAVSGYLTENSDIFRKCANGLTKEENGQLAEQPDPTKAIPIVIGQLQGIPLRQRAQDLQSRSFRILSLDGGGLRGAYTASVLATWERTLNLKKHDDNSGVPQAPSLAEHFDLIVGTSTGAILAVGLALGVSAERIQKFYRDNGDGIFGSGEGFDNWWHSLKHWFTSKYNHQALEDALRDAYGKSPLAGNAGDNVTIDNALTRLAIPIFNSTIDVPEVIRTPHGRFAAIHRGHSAVFVAKASAAAPTYFDPVDLKIAGSRISAVDGGVWANSPVTVGIAEALGELGQSINDISVLSIGTTYTPKLVGQPMILDGSIVSKLLSTMFTGWKKPIASLLGRFLTPKHKVHGVLGWVGNIAGLLMKTQTQTSDLVATNLLGSRYVRVNSVSDDDELGDPRKLDFHVNLGRQAATDDKVFETVTNLFLNGKPADKWRLPPEY